MIAEAVQQHFRLAVRSIVAIAIGNEKEIGRRHDPGPAKTDFDSRDIIQLVIKHRTMVEVPVEVWTYNFGPYKLMRRVRFVDGLVEEIETLGYGYRANAG